jgi:hypothetical protein
LQTRTSFFTVCPAEQTGIIGIIGITQEDDEAMKPLLYDIL